MRASHVYFRLCFTLVLRLIFSINALGGGSIFFYQVGACVLRFGVLGLEAKRFVTAAAVVRPPHVHLRLYVINIRY